MTSNHQENDTKDQKIHWVIEISSVLCQLFVAIATVLLFAG